MTVVHAEPKRHEWGRCANLSVSLRGPRKLARALEAGLSTDRLTGPADGWTSESAPLLGWERAAS